MLFCVLCQCFYIILCFSVVFDTQQISAYLVILFQFLVSVCFDVCCSFDASIGNVDELMPESMPLYTNPNGS